MTSKRLVYALCDPFTDEIRYIGKSSTGMNRPNEHVGRAPKGRTWQYKWIQSLLAKGAVPDIVVLEHNHQSAEELCEAEEFFITYFRYVGARLTNHRDGGHGWKEGGRNIMNDPVVKAKFSASNKGRKLSSETRVRQKAAQSRPHIIEQKSARMTAINKSRKGKPLRREAVEKQKLSRARGRLLRLLRKATTL